MQKRVIIAMFSIAIIAGFFWIHSKYEQRYIFDELEIEMIDHQKRNSSDNTFTESKPFTRYEGDVFGLDIHTDFSVLDFMGPFLRTSGIASGDFNNDNWQDIIFGNRKGILLYKNQGSDSFTLQEVVIPEIKDLNIIVVAFVDIDNDGWQDIYITSYGGQNYFILNDKKGFQNPKVLKVPNGEAIVTHAVSFSDSNKDGWLDFVNGNWSSGGPFSSKLAENKLIMNNNLYFQEKSLREVIGETLSVLFSDFTNDNNPDLIVGNDFADPDIFYEGNIIGELREIKKSDYIIPASAFATMSVDTADFNNDLYMDIYIGGINYATDVNIEIGNNDYCFEIRNIEEKKKCESNLKINEIVKKRDVEGCVDLASVKDKNDCVVMIILNVAIRDVGEEALCDKIPENYSIRKGKCYDYFAPSIDRVIYEESITQTEGGNILLRGSKEGVFQDVSDETDSGNGGWAWNAKFADLDNDEWQDIYIVNGRWDKLPPRSNVFFHNYEGQYFKAEQEKFNLENFNVVSAYTYIDIDNDGDLDIVTAGLNGPTNVYINNEAKNNSITFEFRDRKGNYFGIGNKAYIYYGENSERHQVREIKSGGGFLSFDSPIAHFGLGKYGRVNKVEIVWSTGEKTTLDKEFLANKKYVIKRK